MSVSGFEETPALQRQLMHDFRAAVLPVSIFFCVIIVVGLFGNSIVLYGYAVRYPRCTYRTLILFLALVDIVGCVTVMPAEVINEMFWFEFTFVKVCKAKSYMNITILSLEILLLLVITLDRYKQTCMPNSDQMVSELAVYLFVGCVVAAGILAIPACIAFGEHQYLYQYNGTNVTVVVCGLSEKYFHSNFNLVYSTVLQVTAVLSLFVMFIVYFVIMRTLCRAPREIEMQSETTALVQPDEDEQRSINRRTTQMFVVSMVFIVTALACRVIGFAVSTAMDSFSLKIRVLVIFFYRLYFVNHAIHPLIYGVLDVKFREIMKNICCGFRRSSKSNTIP